MDSVVGDLRYAVRAMSKNRIATAIAILSLAAGIGASSAIFSLANGILLRPRAVSKPNELVELYAGDRANPYQTLSYPSYLELRDRNGVFAGLAAYGVAWQFRLGGSDGVEQVWGEVVSGNYFDVLGVPAYRGRTFTTEDDQVPGRNPVVVISHGLWQRRFESDPTVIGRTIAINNQALTVVGVTPPQYTGMLRGLASEVWIPAMMTPLLQPSRGQTMLTHRGSKWVTLVGRLAPGTSIEQVRARFRLLSRQLQAAHPEEWRSGEGDDVRDLAVSVVPESQTRVHPSMRGAAYALAALLFVIVSLVLLIACMNLASMMLARAVVRRREIAVRMALGADRARIVRHLLTESVLVALVAGAAGLVVAIWGLHAILAFMPELPEGIRIAVDVRLDWRVVAYTMLLSTVTGVLLGLAPALHCARATVSTVLRDESSAFTVRYRTSRARRTLVIGQVACSLLLLVGAGLVLRSLDNVKPTSLGFRSENILVASVTLDEEDYTRRTVHEFFSGLSERIAAIPGVRAVSLVEGMPGGFMSRTRRGTEIEGYVARPGESMEIDAGIVGPGYFTNMGVPFTQGRDFGPSDRDGAPCVAIVNEAFARRYVTGASPLGRHLAGARDATGERQQCAIVGVIRDDAWQSLQKETRPFFALSLYQSNQPRMTVLIDASGDAAALASSVRHAIRGLDSRVPVAGVQTLAQHFDATLYPFRLLAVMIGACGVLALLLAAIGIYGGVSFSTEQRTREVGIRMALGAVRRDILALVIRQGMAPVAYGLGAGLALSVGLTWLLTSLPLDTELLFGVSPTDPLTFGAVTAFLGVVALVACYVPALRAARVDPMVTLRDS